MKTLWERYNELSRLSFARVSLAFDENRINRYNFWVFRFRENWVLSNCIREETSIFLRKVEKVKLRTSNTSKKIWKEEQAEVCRQDATLFLHTNNSCRERHKYASRKLFEVGPIRSVRGFSVACNARSTALRAMPAKGIPKTERRVEKQITSSG